jgi:hypothetical protein
VGDPTDGGPLAQQPDETRLLRRTVAADIRQISGGFEAEIAPFKWLGQWQIVPSTGERQSEEVHLPYRDRTWTLKAGDEMALAGTMICGVFD